MGGWAIALHGGAGMICKEKMSLEEIQRTEAALYQILDIGVTALENNNNNNNKRMTAVDVVELVVRALEDNALFNAGKGSVLTHKGTVEMEASIMDGKTKQCGAVSGLSTVVHPVSLARKVMEESPHVYLAFHGAEEFARLKGVETVDTSFFITEENQEKLERARKTNSVQLDLSDERITDANGNVTGYDYGEDVNNDTDNLVSYGLNGVEAKYAEGNIGGYIHGTHNIHTFKAEFETVGCAVVDSLGNCAAATSTGGLINKMCGRIGDTPIVGAGTYANHLCAISGTGRGEEFIKHTVARDVAAIMEYKELPIGKAVHKVVHELLDKNMGGVVAVSNTGEVAMAFNTPSMFRASAHEGGERYAAIW